MLMLLLFRLLLSSLVYSLPIEVTGQMNVVHGLDVEKTIEAEYDRWVRHCVAPADLPSMDIVHVAGFRRHVLLGKGGGCLSNNCEH